MDSLRPAPASERRETGFRSGGPRDLWRALNAPRSVDGAAVRFASLALLAFYAVGVALRPTTDHPLTLWVRGAVCVYIAVGILLGPRFTWNALRWFTVGLALTLNLATASLILLRAPVPGDLGVMGLVMFAPTAFLQTGRDVMAVAAIVGAGIAVVLTSNPPIAAASVAIVLYGSLLTGAVTALVLILFRDRVSTSTTWWQDACTRERALREFAEGVAPQLGEAGPASGPALCRRQRNLPSWCGGSPTASHSCRRRSRIRRSRGPPRAARWWRCRWSSTRSSPAPSSSPRRRCGR